MTEGATAPLKEDTMQTEKEIRERAARYGISLKKMPEGKIKLTDRVGNEIVVNGMIGADGVARVYREELFTSPLYEVGRKGEQMGIKIAAKNSANAKNKYRTLMRVGNQVELTARKIKQEGVANHGTVE